MFPKVNPLPRAQRQVADPDRYAQVHRRQGRADVGGHIVVAFRGMTKESIPIRNQPGEKALQIPSHFRVGVFLDEEGGGGVEQL